MNIELNFKIDKMNGRKKVIYMNVIIISGEQGKKLNRLMKAAN